MQNHIINQARINYFLGNFTKVLEIWQSNEELGDEYFDFLVARALISVRELKPQFQPQLTRKPSEQLRQITDLVNKFLSPVLKPTKISSTLQEDAKIIEQALYVIKQSFDDQTKYSNILHVICCYLSINATEVEYVQSQENEEKNDYIQIEILFLQLLSYARGKNLEQATKYLNLMKQIDDEDILMHFGQIYYHIYFNKPQETYLYVAQTKERFGESAKLMNLMITALLRFQYKIIYNKRLNRFEEAFELAQRLQQALIEKDQFSDRQEIETCLSNLIVLAEICNKSNIRDESILALQTLNPSSVFLKSLKSKTDKL